MKKENTEIWKDIPGYEGVYQASNLGRVRSLDRNIIRKDNRKKVIKGRIRKTITTPDGYEKLGLYKTGKEKKFNLHQLIAMTFLGHNPCGQEKVVDHIDRNRQNNKVSNLRIVSSRKNSQNRSMENTSSRFSGVYKNTNKKWTTNINIKGKNYNLISTCKTEKEAYNIYLKACKNLNTFDGDIEKFRLNLGLKKKEPQMYFDKSKNKFVSEITIKNERVFLKRFKLKEDALKMHKIATSIKDGFNGDKVKFRDKVKSIFNKQPTPKNNRKSN